MIPIIKMSVVIPVFNGAAFLERAVRSINAQGCYGTEIVIIDDASTDNTVAIAEALREHYPDVRVMRQAENGGPAAARNRGLREARGRFVCFLDADDEYAPGFFNTVLPILEGNPEIAWVSTGVELVNCKYVVHPVQLQAVTESLPSNLIVRKAVAELLGGFPDDPAFRGPYAGEDIMFRTSLRKWFNGVHRPEKFFRQWITPGSHFEKFINRSTVKAGRLIFLHTDEGQSTDTLRAAQSEYRNKVAERMGVVASINSIEEAVPSLSLRRIDAVTQYETLRRRFETIPGRLCPEEGYLLHHFARTAFQDGIVVEVGALHGRATCWLASAVTRKIVAISNFEVTHIVDGEVQRISTLPEFIANLQRGGVRDQVDYRFGDPATIVTQWKEPISMLVLSAEKDAKFSANFYTPWLERVVPGGLVAVCGVGESDENTQGYRAFLAANRTWREIAGLVHLRLMQRGN